MSTLAPNTSSVSAPSASSLERPLFAYWDDSAAMNGIRFGGSLLGFGANIFLLHIIFTSKLRAHQCNWYLGLLAIADIAIAIGLFIRAAYAVHAASLGMVLFSRLTCVLVNTPLGIGFALTRVAVLAIAADRLYMVARPLSYNAKFNKPLFSSVFCIGLLLASADAFTKVYRAEEPTSKPIPLCTMGASQGPLAPWFGQFYSNTCLALLFAIYIPFLCLYRQKSSSASSISSSWHWKRQLQVTGTTVWLLLLYSLLWGGSFALLAIANFAPNPQLFAGCVTYVFGFVSSVCSWSSLFVLFLKHEGIRKQVVKRLLPLRDLLRNTPAIGNKVHVMSISLEHLNVHHPATTMNNTNDNNIRRCASLAMR